MAKLKEKDIVSNIVDNWDTYFPEITFFKKEFCLDSWRPDIVGKMNSDNNRQIPCFFEVKYNKNDRDLVYEVLKGLNFLRKRHGDNEFKLVVITDNISEDFIIDFLIMNNVDIYLYSTDSLSKTGLLEFNKYTKDDFNKRGALRISSVN